MRQRQNEIVELKEGYASLTAREREVMALLVSGMLTKQIASTLGTSEITATVHRGEVVHKMQANSPAELARENGGKTEAFSSQIIVHGPPARPSNA